MGNTFVEVKSNGVITAKRGSNARSPYEHQKKAMENLDIIDKLDDYSTLVVLPTGGGKTYTASLWLLKSALNKHKKILWIAHRQMLLDQAAESFQKYAYAETLPNVTNFNYRIVSGAVSHDRTIDIIPSDNLLIASKDSLGRNISSLDAWLEGEEYNLSGDR
jgi:superfamily II DNA or RNA helicase